LASAGLPPLLKAAEEKGSFESEIRLLPAFFLLGVLFFSIGLSASKDNFRGSSVCRGEGEANEGCSF
jgi:hypothetical protein